MMKKTDASQQPKEVPIYSQFPSAIIVGAAVIARSIVSQCKR